MKIVVSEMVHEDALELLQRHAELFGSATLFKHQGDLAATLQVADALIVRNQTRVDEALLDHAPTLKVVGRVGVGLDNLALGALHARGVTVTWAPGTNAVSVAEYVIGAMLVHSRRFEQVSSRLHGGGWDREAAIGAELYGKTLGIIGLGDIGARLAKRADAFGMTVLASDPAHHAGSFAVQEYGVTLLGLTELLEQADFVSLHTPLLTSTQTLINPTTLAAMKPGAVLINTARGGLVDEYALATALHSGHLGGAVLDVRQHEPPGEGDPLRGLANVLLTPHVAGVTEASNRRASLHVAEDVLRVLRGERPQSAVPNG